MTNPYAPPTAVVDDISSHGRLEPAGRGARLGASILDGIIFCAMVYVPFLAGAVALGASAGAEEDAQAGAILGASGIVALVGFVVWVWLTLRFMSSNGQSIAKKIVGIKVVRSDGSRISLGRLIWMRNVLNWFISIVPLYGLIDSLFIFGEDRQCLHDKIADSIVVKA
jgi:uncharacterized RDD family membrane protein YckC